MKEHQQLIKIVKANYSALEGYRKYYFKNNLSGNHYADKTLESLIAAFYNSCSVLGGAIGMKHISINGFGTAIFSQQEIEWMAKNQKVVSRGDNDWKIPDDKILWVTTDGGVLLAIQDKSKSKGLIDITK